jgi:hypothetical protein
MKTWFNKGKRLYVNSKRIFCDVCSCICGELTDYYVDINAPDGGDGLTWQTAFNNFEQTFDGDYTRKGSYYIKAGTYTLSNNNRFINSPIGCINFFGVEDNVLFDCTHINGGSFFASSQFENTANCKMVNFKIINAQENFNFIIDSYFSDIECIGGSHIFELCFGGSFINCIADSSSEHGFSQCGENFRAHNKPVFENCIARNCNDYGFYNNENVIYDTCTATNNVYGFASGGAGDIEGAINCVADNNEYGFGGAFVQFGLIGILTDCSASDNNSWGFNYCCNVANSGLTGTGNDIGLIGGC